MKKLVAASGNPGKLREFEQVLAPLAFEIVPQAALGIRDAEEPYETFVENALVKARHASRESRLAAFADDSGICVAALAGAPGVHSARYAAQPGTVLDRETQDRATTKNSSRGFAVNPIGARTTTVSSCWCATPRTPSRLSRKGAGTAN